MIGDADLDFEVGDLFLRAGVAGHGRGGDLAHHAVDLAVGIGVDADARGVADLHVDDVVFVDVDARLHVLQVGDAHHFRSRELHRADHALADAAGQRADAAVRGRVDDGLRQRVVDLPQRPLGTLDLEQRRVERRLGDLVIGLRGVAVGLGKQLRLEELPRALVILLRLGQLRLVAHARRTRGIERRLLRLHLRLIAVRLDAQQELALAHCLPFLHRNLDDLTRDLGGDLHFHFRLDLAGRRDELRHRLAEGLVRGDRNRLLALARGDHPAQDQEDDDSQADEKEESLLRPLHCRPLSNGATGRRFHFSNWVFRFSRSRSRCKRNISGTAFPP